VTALVLGARSRGHDLAPCASPARGCDDAHRESLADHVIIKLVVMLGVLQLVTQGFAIDRLVGVPAPIWLPRAGPVWGPALAAQLRSTHKER
jgi:hypothetical protein